MSKHTTSFYHFLLWFLTINAFIFIFGVWLWNLKYAFKLESAHKEEKILSQIIKDIRQTAKETRSKKEEIEEKFRDLILQAQVQEKFEKFKRKVEETAAE